MIIPGVWAGIGYEVGGEIVVGTSYGRGTIFCLSDPDKTVRVCTFAQRSVSLGLGLGGAYSPSFIFGFNIGQPSDVDGAASQFDFSLDTGLASDGVIGKYIRDIPDYLMFWHQFEEGIRRHLFSAGKAMALANNYKVLKQVAANQAGLRDLSGGKPALIVVPLPVGGAGLRVSVRYKLTTTDVLGWNAADFSSAESSSKALRAAYSPF